MKIILDIKDSKVDFVMELLKNLSFVKVKKLTPAKAMLMEELKDAVMNVNMAKQGKIKPKSLNALLDEL